MKGTTRKYKLRDGSTRYLYKFDIPGIGADGKRHQQWKRGFMTKREADDELAKAIAKQKKGASAAKDTQLFADAFNEWRVEYGNAHWEPSTRESSERRCAYAVQLFGKFKLGELSTQQIDIGLNHLKLHGGQKTKEHPKGKPLSPKTCHSIYSLMRQFFAQMVIWDKIEKNPMLGVKAPTGASDSQAEALTFDEYNCLLARVKDTRYYAMAVFGAESGARCGELLALQWRDIDFETGDVHIGKSLQQTQEFGLRVKLPKNSKTRISRIGDETLEVLREHRRMIERDRELFAEDYEPNDLVFCSPRGEYLKPKQVSGRLSQFMKEAGIEKSLHKLRHFCATVRLSNGESIPAVAAHLGHDPNVLLKIYAHVMPGDRARGVSIWEKAMQERAQKPQPEPPSAVLVMPRKKLLAGNDTPQTRSTASSTSDLRLVNVSK